MRTLQIFLSAGVALISVAFVIAAIGDLVQGDPSGTGVGVLVFLLLFFGAVAAGGIALVRKLLRSPRSADPERLVLQLARARGGRLTVAEAAAESDLDVAECKRLLHRLAEQGVAEIDVAEDGTIVYRFSGFLSADEKARARSVVDA